MRCIIIGTISASLVALAGCNGPTSEGEFPTSENTAPADGALEIHIAPRLENAVVQSIDVTMRIAEPGVQAGEPFLSMAIVRATMPGALSDPANLIAEDENGVIPMTIEEDPVDPSNFRQDRRWIPTRASVGDIQIRYPITPRVITPRTRPGPLFDVRAEGAGFYGSGSTMLALPIDGWPRNTRITWDLSEMPAGSRAATSLGEGDIEAEATDDNLTSTYFMAGPLYSEPPDGASDFVVYWLTPPVFDLASAAQWTQHAYRYASEFFGREESDFRIFMRTTKCFQGGGSGGYKSFIFGTVAGEDRNPEELRSLLAHEAFHSFVGGLGTGGSSGAGGQWYSEGANSYYTIVLPYRAGLTSLDQVARAFNDHALNYYTNPKSNLSNEDVTRLFFSDNNAQLVPYNRGPLYFAIVDARMRKMSGGKRRVDELVLQFIDGRDEAEDPVAYWRSLVVDALGEKGGVEFNSMMSGMPLDLPSNLLGPCFEAETRKLQRFQLGYRPYEGDEGSTHAGPVIPGSAAQAAGIRADDEILNPETLEMAENAGQGAAITLNIRRDGETLEVSYAPWTEPRPGKQWVRTEVPAQECDI